MKDRIFTGQDVEEALASAAASLGLPLRDLRYVVLEPGTEGGRGLKPTPARIAILLHDPAAAPDAAAAAERPGAEPLDEAPAAPPPPARSATREAASARS